MYDISKIFNFYMIIDIYLSFKNVILKGVSHYKSE